jgi:hypothetical protein
MLESSVPREVTDSELDVRDTDVLSFYKVIACPENVGIPCRQLGTIDRVRIIRDCLANGLAVVKLETIERGRKKSIKLRN